MHNWLFVFANKIDKQPLFIKCIARGIFCQKIILNLQTASYSVSCLFRLEYVMKFNIGGEKNPVLERQA